MKSHGFLVSCAFVVLGILLMSVYTVDETQQAVITQFGKVKGAVVRDAGIHGKVPFVDQVNYFPKTVMEWDGERGEITTKNKSYIWVEAFARWKIYDPIVFLKKCESEAKAVAIMGQLIDPAVKNAIAAYDLIEAVRNTNRAFDTKAADVDQEQDKNADEQASYTINMGREKITEQILEQAKPKLADFGIELVDVKIKRINYREDVQKTVFERIIAERMQIVEKYKSSGRGEAQKITGDKEKELKRITSEAYKKAQTIKGNADARVARIYSSALSLDPEFYSFLKSLDVYNKAVDKNSTIVLSTDSEFLKYMNRSR
jgi:membrane protease subunit HflC